MRAQYLFLYTVVTMINRILQVVQPVLVLCRIVCGTKVVTLCLNLIARYNMVNSMNIFNPHCQLQLPLLKSVHINFDPRSTARKPRRASCASHLRNYRLVMLGMSM